MSGVFRNIVSPPHHRPGGGHTLWVERGWGPRSIVRKTPDTALYSIYMYVSTLWLDGSATEQRKPTAFGAIFGRMCKGTYILVYTVQSINWKLETKKTNRIAGIIILFNFFIQLIHSYITFIHVHSMRPISISSQLSALWTEPPWGAEPSFELGPVLQPASTTTWATLHPKLGFVIEVPSISWSKSPRWRKKLFTSSLIICTEGLCRKGWGRAELLPSWSVESKDVILYSLFPLWSY